MPRIRYERKTAQIPELLELLDRFKIEYVITGSFAAQAWGVDVQPNHLDVTPDLAPDNLTRVAALLAEIDATPFAFGHWETREDGERSWTMQATTPEMIEAWQPDTNSVPSFDHLFVTRFGDFDVVPDLCGGFAALRARAVRRELRGQQAMVAHLDDLLATMTVPRRDKDAPRVRQLREIQHAYAAGEHE